MYFSRYVSMFKNKIKVFSKQCDYSWLLKSLIRLLIVGPHIVFYGECICGFIRETIGYYINFCTKISFPSERDGFHLNFLSTLNTNITIHGNGFHSSVGNTA